MRKNKTEGKLRNDLEDEAFLKVKFYKVARLRNELGYLSYVSHLVPRYSDVVKLRSLTEFTLQMGF